MTGALKGAVRTVPLILQRFRSIISDGWWILYCVLDQTLNVGFAKDIINTF